MFPLSTLSPCAATLDTLCTLRILVCVCVCLCMGKSHPLRFVNISSLFSSNGDCRKILIIVHCSVKFDNCRTGRMAEECNGSARLTSWRERERREGEGGKGTTRSFSSYPQQNSQLSQFVGSHNLLCMCVCVCVFV